MDEVDSDTCPESQHRGNAAILYGGRGRIRVTLVTSSGSNSTKTVPSLDPQPSEA
jgi:hypothetical protein